MLARVKVAAAALAVAGALSFGALPAFAQAQPAQPAQPATPGQSAATPATPATPTGKKAAACSELKRGSQEYRDCMKAQGAQKTDTAKEKAMKEKGAKAKGAAKKTQQ